MSVNGVVQPVQQNIDWLGTVRPRLGVLPIDRLLIFASGGVAFGGVGVSSFGPNVGTYANSSCGSGSAWGTNAGWTAGGGLEYAWSNRLSVKAEHLVDLGSNSVTYPITLAVSQSTTASEFRANIVRVGINCRFD